MPEIFEKWGFGMAPAKPETLRERRFACSRVLALLNLQSSPPPTSEILPQISIVKGLFNRVVREDQWDWFTVMGQLGYPSPSLARQIASELRIMRDAIHNSADDRFQVARRNLCSMPTRLCLQAFLGEKKIVDEKGAGWIYVLSTREFPDLLKIGMTTRTVEQRVNEINAATGVVVPFGVRRCWRVMSPALAEKAVHQALNVHRIRADREFFRADFKVAIPTVHQAISATGLEIRTLQALASLG